MSQEPIKEKETEKTEKIEKIDKRKTMPHLFKPGQSGNPAGRPRGARNFDVLFREAIKRIAKSENLKIDDPDVTLIVKGLSRALNGNYPFWRDLMDRRFGKPKETVELEGQVNITNFIDIIKYANKFYLESSGNKELPNGLEREPDSLQRSNVENLSLEEGGGDNDGSQGEQGSGS